MVTKPLNQPREPLGDDSEITQPPPDFVLQETEPAPPPPELSAERTGPAWRVLLHISSGQPTSVGLDIWRVTVLGRADPMSAFRPDLDFTPHGAMRHGVSRRHALIRPSEGSLNLIDQGSTNGTWINGQRLMPGREFPLTDGDTIELGALRMTLRIVKRPTDSETFEETGSEANLSRRRRFGWPQE